MTAGQLPGPSFSAHIPISDTLCSEGRLHNTRSTGPSSLYLVCWNVLFTSIRFIVIISVLTLPPLRLRNAGLYPCTHIGLLSAALCVKLMHCTDWQQLLQGAYIHFISSAILFVFSLHITKGDIWGRIHAQRFYTQLMLLYVQASMTRPTVRQLSWCDCC